MKRRWVRGLTDNFSYKIVALFISLVLWLTILGRRDFVLSKTIDIDLITAPGTQVVLQTATQVKVKVSGPRSALKKFLDSSLAEGLAIDISQRGEGVLYIDIPSSKIEVPLGVRVLGVRPNQIQAEVIKLKGSSSEDK